MGNIVGVKSGDEGNSRPGQSSLESIDIDLNGVIRQCQAFCDSIEHQTTAALDVLGSQHAAVTVLKENKTPAGFRNVPVSRENFTIDQLERNQTTLVDQMKGLQSAGESFSHLVQPFTNGIYPVNLRLPNEDVLKAKDDTIDALRAEFVSLKKEYQLLQKEVSEKDKLKQTNIDLQKESADLKNNIESIKRINTQFLKDNNNSVEEKDSLRRENYSLSTETIHLKEQISQLKRQNYNLEQENKTSSGITENLRKQLELQKKRKLSVHVQLFSPRKGDLAATVIHEMRAMLETQFEVEDRMLTVSVCDNYTDITPDMAVLILCINASRLGSDVDSALHGLTLNKSQGLVILHHKDTHALPNQPSERMLTSSTSDYKKLGGIFDMAFLSGKGIYPCDMNNRAVSELVGFIKAFSPSQ